MDDDKIAMAFEVFHNRHPWVYEKLRDMALELKRSGVKQYGISGLYEKLRYDYSVQARDIEGFKLNNNFSALYARMLAQQEPELRYFFKFRARRPQYTQRMSPDVDAWDRLIYERAEA